MGTLRWGPQAPKSLVHRAKGGSLRVKLTKNGKISTFFLKIKNSLMISPWDVDYGLVRIRGHRTTNGVTGDEGSSIGVHKMRKMCKNGKNWENGQKWAKNNEKK